VPRFTGERYAASFGYQWNRFSRTQLDSANGTTESRDTFVEKTGFPLEDLRGKRVLEVGCGMGRFLEVVADAGAEVVGIDISTAVNAAFSNVGSRPNVDILQADVFALPFADGAFDYIYSIGVLHHTPDTRKAFLELPRLLAPRGRIAIWVYATRLRMFVGGALLRQLTKHLPTRVLLELCRVARPWGAMVRAIPQRHLRFLAQLGATVSLHPDPDWRVLDTFDWYSPRYQHKHSRAELRRWMTEAGLTELRDLEFPVSMSARRP
jgi:SAM-dependent methyltransferase